MRECNFKIKTTLEDAKERYLKFVETDEEYEWDDIQKCLCIGEVYVSERKNYILFEDMNGEAFFGLETEAWLNLAQNNELVYAYYDENDNAEFINIKDGICIQEFRIYDNEIDTDISNGKDRQSLISWIDVAEFIDENLH